MKTITLDDGSEDVVSPCGLCDVYMPLEFLSVCEVFPVDLACEHCQQELLADDYDPREQVCDVCDGSGCGTCLGLSVCAGGF